MAFDKNTPISALMIVTTRLRSLLTGGLLGQLPHYAGPDESHVASILDGKHPHHWLVACHFVGHMIKGVQSPYAVFAFSKLLSSREGVSVFIEHLGRQFGATGTPVIDLPKPNRN